MAKPESDRVDNHRRKHFDQVAVLVEKGGRAFFRSLANRAGTNVSEMARTAILHHAGLNVLPYPDDLAAAGDLDDHKQIGRALRHLQTIERTMPDEMFNELSPDPYPQMYESTTDPEDTAALYRFCLSVCAQIRKQRAQPQPDPLTAETAVIISGRDMAMLRRVLANAEVTQDSVIIPKK